MNTALRATLAMTVALGFVIASPLGAVADGEIAAGRVATSERTGNTATYTVVAPDDATPNQVVGFRGASFAFPLWDAYADAYNADADTTHTVGYLSTGSGGGITGFTGNGGLISIACTDAARFTDQDGCPSAHYEAARAGWVVGGMSDAPLSTSQYASAFATGGEVVHLPLAIGTVTVAYNVGGACSGETLQLTPAMISGLFDDQSTTGAINNWGDAALRADGLNGCLDGVDLPVTPCIRSDGSGTTYVFVDYLNTASGTPWTVSTSQTAIAAQVDGEIAAPQNPGVSSCIGAAAGRVGYIELAQAVNDGRNIAAVKNPAGFYVLPSEESGQAAADGAAPTLPAAHESWTGKSIVNAPGAGSYPISSFTYFMAYSNPYDVISPTYGAFTAKFTAAQYAAAKDVVQWFIDHPEVMPDYYSPLGPDAKAIVQAGLDRMSYERPTEHTIADVSSEGFPEVGQTVEVESDGVFTVVAGDWTAIADATVLHADDFVSITGTGVFASGNLVMNGLGQVTAVRAPHVTGTPANGVFTGTVYGQVVNNVLVIHSFE